MVSRNRKIARRIGQAVANDVLDISGAISAGAGVTVYATADDLPTTGLTAGDEAFVSGSNRLYISNGTGWYSIGLVNTNPAITSVEDPSSNTTPFTLATDGSALVLTITAADPEGIPLTYNYAVTTGSLTNGGGTTATVVQGTGANTNQFTITPTTTEAYAGTFELTFTTSDGINQASSVNSFTLNFITTIANSRYTTLLATATDTSDNNNITDASSNNHSITVNGDAYAGTFSPYRSGGYSTYFDGTGDNLDISASSDFDFGTGDFTFEMSFYAEANTGTWQYLVTNRASGWGAGVFRFMVDATASSLYCTFYGYDLGGYDIEPETWNHVSAVKSGDTITLYLNGATPTPAGGWYQSYSGVNNVSMGSSSKDVDVGSAGTSDYFKGYIRDLRIVKGIAITPPSGGPTERLEAVTNTSLLTCHLPYIVDGSTNDHSITLNGNTSTKPFSPYDYTEYSTTDHGGSVYFDGSGDRITASTSNNFAIGSSEDFIIEAWIYPTNTSQGNFHLFGIHQATYTGGIYLDYHSSDFRIGDYGGGWDVRTTSTVPLIYNTWQHICASRTGNLIKIFFNGESLALSSQGEAHTNSYNAGAIAIGGSGVGTDFQGFISDIRFEKGTSRTSNFTPPIAQLSSSGAELHIKGTAASIIDKAQGGNLKLVGSVDNGWGLDKFITSQQAVEFNGSTQYLTVAGSSDFDFGSNDFTVEAWVYTDSSDGQVITSGRSSGSSWIFLDKTTSNTIRILISTDGSSWAVNSTSTETMTLSRWNHISVSRDGSTINMYLNGRLIISTSISGSIHYDTSKKIAIGSGENDRTDRGWNGYISDFRIINGTAVVPPVNGPNEALTEVTNTKLLTCRPSGASITDLSTTGTTHTITSISSTAAAYASPFGKAMHFDGTGDYISIPADDRFVLGSDAMTIEFWLNLSSSADNWARMVECGSYNKNDTWHFAHPSNTSTISFVIGHTTTRPEIVTTTSLSYSTWYHIAVARSGNTLKLFLDGTQEGGDLSYSGSFVGPDHGALLIGTGSTSSSSSTPQNFMHGYIQDLRVTKGLARYTANFTPPTASLEG